VSEKLGNPIDAVLVTANDSRWSEAGAKTKQQTWKENYTQHGPLEASRFRSGAAIEVHGGLLSNASTSKASD
jgi:hypothetical protein